MRMPFEGREKTWEDLNAWTAAYRAQLAELTEVEEKGTLMGRMKKPLQIGDRVEVIWEDAHEGYGDAAPGSITMLELGYWGGYSGRGSKRVLVLWRRVDEFGEFYGDGKIPVKMVQKVRRLGGRPRGSQKGRGAR